MLTGPFRFRGFGAGPGLGSNSALLEIGGSSAPCVVNGSGMRLAAADVGPDGPGRPGSKVVRVPLPLNFFLVGFAGDESTGGDPARELSTIPSGTTTLEGRLGSSTEIRSRLPLPFESLVDAISASRLVLQGKQLQ